MTQDLISLLCHELRTPLTAVLGYLDIVLEDGEDAAGHRDDYLRRAQTNVQHIAELLNGVHELARLQRPGAAFNAQHFPAGQLVRQVADSFTCREGCEGRVLRTQIEDAPLYTIADRERLAQALANLVSNACKYTANGGMVTLGARQEGTSVVLEVSDTGIGIPPDEYDRVFTPFYRGSNARSIGPRGTGLSLAVTHTIVRLLGGEMRFHSELDRGTTFAIYLPLAPAAAESVRHTARRA